MDSNGANLSRANDVTPMLPKMPNLHTFQLPLSKFYSVSSKREREILSRKKTLVISGRGSRPTYYIKK